MNVWARHGWICCAFVAAMLALVWTVEASGQEPPAPTLLDALEREAIPLRSELDALRRQRSEAERNSKARIDALRREVEALTRRREAAWRSIAESERTLRTLDARLDSMPQSTGDPSKVLTRAERRLLPNAEPLDDPGERLTRVFTAAGERLLQASRVRRDENVSFFLADGSRVEGTVITVGTVAAAGVTSDGQGGPLVPLPEAPGAGQVVMEAGPEVTAYLRSDGGGPLPVLVVDPRHPPSLDAVRGHRSADEALNEHTWRDTITDAAPVGYVILGLGIEATASLGGLLHELQQRCTDLALSYRQMGQPYRP
ncbi:MAG: hypothetical protein AAFX99_04825, partial [Myxococcota bacterium]